jgi:ribonuclease HI
MIRAWTDGATHRYAIVFDKEELHKVVKVPIQYQYIMPTEKVTNNVGEYLAIRFALEMCVSLGIRGVTVVSDSELCVKQLNGEYSIKNEKLQELWKQVKEFEGKLSEVIYQWIPREQNLAGRLLG